MPGVKVTTRMMASQTFIDEFADFTTAKKFVDREIEKLQAFYRTVMSRQSITLTTQEELTMHGDMIVRVLHPAVKLFNIQANFLVLFRIDRGLEVEVLDQEAMTVA